MQYLEISKMIDHAILSPNLTQVGLESGCGMARAYQVASVCAMPFFVRQCAELLQGSGVKASATIGFPHGGHTTATKRYEAEQAIRDGCEELDMVVNISQVLSGNWTYVRHEIAEVTQVAHAAGQRVKVIFENCYLQAEHKLRLCEISSELGVDWVKTSTGFGTAGATLDDLQLMRRHTPQTVQVKAAGGIRDYDTLLSFRELGVSRCGTSRTREILDECRRRLGLEVIAYGGPDNEGY